MTPVRLLIVIVLLCTASAFSQEQLSLTTRPTAEAEKSAHAAATEPWKLVINQPADWNSGKNRLEQFQIDAYKIDRSRIDPNDRPFRWGSQIDPVVVDRQLGDDTICYKIRSYVVARDNKDSDSVHPVGYSTCQPASRYRLKKVDLHTDPSGK